ncbi:hypothetical protein [Brevundimonas sp.]|uniref:hypothetical protein n=1 Tax=Brevundimonas sp. TaxID=1871086 RepID=UPI0025E83D44|nr:hypothetical protein [Brevundimonas sp.]
MNHNGGRFSVALLRQWSNDIDRLFRQAKLHEHGSSLADEVGLPGVGFYGSVVNSQSLGPVLADFMGATERQRICGVCRIQLERPCKRDNSPFHFPTAYQRRTGAELGVAVIGERRGDLHPTRQYPIAPTVRGVVRLNAKRCDFVGCTPQPAGQRHSFRACPKVR